MPDDNLYRTRSETILAKQFLGIPDPTIFLEGMCTRSQYKRLTDDFLEFVVWFHHQKSDLKKTVTPPIERVAGRKLEIRTGEGTVSLSAGDWIIIGVQGEIITCKPEMFSQAYEPITKEESSDDR